MSVLDPASGIAAAGGLIAGSGGLSVTAEAEVGFPSEGIVVSG